MAKKSRRVVMAHSDMQKPLVFLIDDDQELREVLEQALLKQNFDVITDEDGQAGFDRLFHLNCVPDLIVIDNCLPGMLGTEFARQKKEYPQFSHVPLILISSDKDLEAQLPGLSVDHFLKKPLKLDDFMKQVKSAMVSA